MPPDTVVDAPVPLSHREPPPLWEPFRHVVGTEVTPSSGQRRAKNPLPLAAVKDKNRLCSKPRARLHGISLMFLLEKGSLFGLGCQADKVGMNLKLPMAIEPPHPRRQSSREKHC